MMSIISIMIYVFNIIYFVIVILLKIVGKVVMNVMMDKEKIVYLIMVTISYVIALKCKIK